MMLSAAVRPASLLRHGAHLMRRHVGDLSIVRLNPLPPTGTMTKIGERRVCNDEILFLYPQCVVTHSLTHSFIA
jgi:hypothetical protein